MRTVAAKEERFALYLACELEQSLTWQNRWSGTGRIIQGSLAVGPAGGGHHQFQHGIEQFVGLGQPVGLVSHSAAHRAL